MIRKHIPALLAAALLLSALSGCSGDASAGAAGTSGTGSASGPAAASENNSAGAASGSAAGSGQAAASGGQQGSGQAGSAGAPGTASSEGASSGGGESSAHQGTEPLDPEGGAEAAWDAAMQHVAENEGRTERKETLYFSGLQWGSVNNWNPLSPNSNNGMAIAVSDYSRVPVYETLYLFNPLDGSLTGLLAQGEPEWNEDMTALTVHVKPAARWSDGTPVTAEDVRATFDAHVRYKTGTGGMYTSYIEEIEVPDEHTVVFKARLNDDGEAVNPLKVLEFLPRMYILSGAYLSEVEERCGGEAEAILTDPMDDFISSGPYRPCYISEERVVLMRDDHYWGADSSMWGRLPAPKYLAHMIYPDNATGAGALEAGDVDVCQQFIPGIEKLWLTKNLPISTWLDEPPYGLCTVMSSMFFNTRKAGLDRVEVRRAIAMAIDYARINAAVMRGQSPSFTDYPRCIVGPTKAERDLVDEKRLAGLQFSGKDPAGAEAILDQAGIVDTDGDGIREIDGVNLSFRAECPKGWTDWTDAMEIVAHGCRSIGLDVQTYFPEAQEYYADMTGGNFDIGIWASPGASVAGPWSKAMFFLSAAYGSIEENNWMGNFGGYINDEADDLLKRLPAMTDKAEIREAYTRLSEILLTDLPAVVLMYRPGEYYAVNESVWFNYPSAGDRRNIPPLILLDGYGIAGLYDLENTN